MIDDRLRSVSPLNPLNPLRPGWERCESDVMAQVVRHNHKTQIWFDPQQIVEKSKTLAV